MVKFLVENGIDSISVNADVAKEIADYVQELESTILKGTDKEPRQYELKKQEEEIEKNIRKNKETPENREKRINKDIEAIEKEKKEYLKKHPE